MQQVLVLGQARQVWLQQVRALRVRQEQERGLVLGREPQHEEPQLRHRNRQQQLPVSSWNRASTTHRRCFSRPTDCHCYASCQWFGRQLRSQVLR